MIERGVRLGVDVGTVRIGVARSDPDGLVATPVETVARAASGPAVPAAGDGPTAPADVARIVEIVGEESAVVVYVGLPRSLSGAEGSSALAVRDYSVTLARALAPVPVRLVDERMTTVSAHQALHASGRSGRKHRAVVDQVAAVMILQSALDTERSSGGRGGAVVDPGPPGDLGQAHRAGED